MAGGGGAGGGDGRVNAALVKERARRDPQWWVFESGYIRTKDEHDSADPIKPIPDTPYLRALLDVLCVSGHVTPPQGATHALAAGINPLWLEVVAQTGTVFIEKSRQIMATWLCCIYAHWRARSRPHQLILIQSKREEDAAKLVYVKEPSLGRISFLEDHLPKPLRMTTWPRSGTYGQLFVQHPDGVSHIWGIPEGGDVIRSNTPSVVIADEAAFQADFGRSYTAARPAVQGGGQYVAISTAEPGEFCELVEGRVA